MRDKSLILRNFNMRAGWQAPLDQQTQVVHEMGTSTRTVRHGAQIEQPRSRLRLYRRIFPPAIAAALSAWRIARLAVNTLAHLALVFLTLGLATGICRKFVTYGCQLVWVLTGVPERWGLLGKCGTVRLLLIPAGVRGTPYRRTFY